MKKLYKKMLDFKISMFSLPTPSPGVDLFEYVGMECDICREKLVKSGSIAKNLAILQNH